MTVARDILVLEELIRAKRFDIPDKWPWAVQTDGSVNLAIYREQLEDFLWTIDQDELEENVREAESKAGWDPNP